MKAFKEKKNYDWAIIEKSSREIFFYLHFLSFLCACIIIILIANFILSFHFVSYFKVNFSNDDLKILRNLPIRKTWLLNWIQIYFNVIHFIDYDYDFVGFSDYRGGYNEFYDDYYRSFDGDYPYSSSVAPGGQRPGRQNSVGFKSFFDFK